MKRFLSPTLAALVFIGVEFDSLAQQTMLRVVVPSAPVRAGPGGSFEAIGSVGSGEVFTALERSPDGTWWRIRLARGVSGWIFAELVWPFQVVDESELGRAQSWLQRNLLGEGRLQSGRFSLSVSAGALGGDALFDVRVGFLTSEQVLLEAAAAQSAGRYGNVLCTRAEMLLLIGPARFWVPYAAAGGGLAYFTPHRQAEVFQSGHHLLASAGGGVLLQLKGSFVLRFDVRHLMMFGPGASWSALSLMGGLLLVY